MKKATAFLVTVLGVLALTGAGCNKTEETINTTEEKETATSTTTTTSEESGATEEASQIEATVEALGNGAVSVKWTVPENFDRTKSFQVLHSAKPNPVHPTAFWFQYMNDTRTTELNNVTPGKRYFRVCAFDLTKNECASFSNEVELEVK
ncbi:MAG: hypothetical protein WC725_02495 [Patescibacteria group bacterium]|jgi:hypothetical protein